MPMQCNRTALQHTLWSFVCSVFVSEMCWFSSMACLCEKAFLILHKTNSNIKVESKPLTMTSTSPSPPPASDSVSYFTDSVVVFRSANYAPSHRRLFALRPVAPEIDQNLEHSNPLNSCRRNLWRSLERGNIGASDTLPFTGWQYPFSGCLCILRLLKHQAALNSITTILIILSLLQYRTLGQLFLGIAPTTTAVILLVFSYKVIKNHLKKLLQLYLVFLH